MDTLVDKYVVKSGDVKHRELESESVLLNLDNGNYYTLNETGTFFWSLIDGKSSVKQLIDKVLEKFDVDKEGALKDISDLVSSLKKEGLVELHDRS